MGKTKVKGIVVQIGGDTVGLDKALEGVNKQANNTQSQLKEVERLLKLDPTNTTLLEQKQRLLAKSISETREKLDMLNQANENVRGSIKNYDEWKKAFDPIQSEIDTTQKKLKDLKKQQEEMADCGEVDTDAYKALTKEIQDTAQELRDLKKQAKEVNDQFGNPISQEAFDALQREIIETEAKMKSLQQASSKNLDKLGDSVDDVKKKMNDLGEAATQVKSKASKVAEAFEPVTKAVLGAATAAAATVPATQELRDELARLDTNAMENAVAADTVREAWKTFAVQSGDTGASVEAVSNLLQAGFTESNLQKAVEGLAGAAQRFPDTLKVESLADGLQETLATRSATGAFAELMERLGMNTELFNNKLGECIYQEQRLNLALDVLAKAGLADSYNSWKQNNEEMVRNKQANLEMELAMAEFAETVLPYVTRAIEMVTELIKRFNDLPEPVKENIATLVLLVGCIAPVASAVSGVSSLISKLSGGELPGLGAALSGIGTKTLPNLGSVFSSVFGFIINHPMGQLVSAIVGLVAVTATNGDEIQAKLQEVDDYVQNVFARDWTETFGPGLGGALNDACDAWSYTWDSFKAKLNGVIDFIRGVFTGDWDRVWSSVAEIMSGYFITIEAIINNCIDRANRLIDLINNIAGTDFQKIEQLTYGADLYAQTHAGDGRITTGDTVGIGASEILASSELTTVQVGTNPLNSTANYYYNQTRSLDHVSNVNFTVNAAPGMSTQELVDLMAEELQRMIDNEENGLR